MLDNNLKKIIVNTLVDEIKNIELITLFGSVTNSYFEKNKSDIDIAFLSLDNIGNVQRWNIQEKLASLLNIDIDLVDLKNSNDVLRFEAILKGENIFIKPSNKMECFLDSVYINYIQLNEDRAEILQAYQ